MGWANAILVGADDVLSQQCGAQAWTLRTQDDGETGTVRTKHRQRAPTPAPSTPYLQASGMTFTLYSTEFVFLMRGIIDQWLPALGGKRPMAAIDPFLWSVQRGARLIWLFISFVRIQNI